MQLVLVEQREDLMLVVDEGHHFVERHAGDEEARPQHDVDHRAVAGREDRRLRQVPLRAFSSCARVVSTCACDAFTCAWAVAICALTWATDARSPLTRRRASRAPAARPRARRHLRGELVDVGLRLLEIETIAGAGGDELGVLLNALARQLEGCRQRIDLSRGLVQLLVQLALAGLRVGQPGLHFGRARWRSAPTFASSDASCASSDRTSF